MVGASKTVQYAGYSREFLINLLKRKKEKIGDLQEQLEQKEHVIKQLNIMLDIRLQDIVKLEQANEALSAANETLNETNDMCNELCTEYANKLTRYEEIAKAAREEIDAELKSLEGHPSFSERQKDLIKNAVYWTSNRWHKSV